MKRFYRVNEIFLKEPMYYLFIRVVRVVPRHDGIDYADSRNSQQQLSLSFSPRFFPSLFHFLSLSLLSQFLSLFLDPSCFLVPLPLLKYGLLLKIRQQYIHSNKREGQKERGSRLNAINLVETTKGFIYEGNI